MSLFEMAIIAFITLSILFHVWKGGATNPVGTGKLQHDVSNVRQQVTALGSRVGHVEEDMKELKKEAATTKDIAIVRVEIEGHRALSQATNDSVRRIERLLIEKGLGGK